MVRRGRLRFLAGPIICRPCEAPMRPASRPPARPCRRARTGSTKSNTTAYMRLRVSRSFSRSTFFFSNVSRGLVRAQFCIDGTGSSFCLAALSGHPRSPKGRAARREGLTAKARAKQQWCPAITLQTASAFLLIPLSLVDVPIIQSTQGGALSQCGTRRINLYPVGTRGPVPWSLMQQCEGTGLQGWMGPFYIAAYCSHVASRSHIQPWNR
jgi:hypothetical protein